MKLFFVSIVLLATSSIYSADNGNRDRTPPPVRRDNVINPPDIRVERAQARELRQQALQQPDLQRQNGARRVLNFDILAPNLESGNVPNVAPGV